MLSIGCLVDWEVEGFGDDEEEVVEEEEGEEDDIDELDEEDDEDVVEDVSDSESLSSEDSAESLVAFCFKDGNTVGARTDRPGISNVAFCEHRRFRLCVIFDSPTTIW